MIFCCNYVVTLSDHLYMYICMYMYIYICILYAICVLYVLYILHMKCVRQFLRCHYEKIDVAVIAACVDNSARDDLGRTWASQIRGKSQLNGI